MYPSDTLAAIPFEPVASAQDPAVEDYARHRLEGLARFRDVADGRLEPAGARLFAGHLVLAERLDPLKWRSVVQHPLYSWWWTKLCHAFASGDASAIHALLRELGRLLLIPAVCQGALDEPIELPPCGPTLRLPGSRRHLCVLPFRGDRPVLARAEGSALRLDDGVKVVEVELERLFGNGTATDGIRERPTVPGTSIEVDATDPWITEFLEEENHERPSPGRTVDDVRGTPPDDEFLQRVAAALRLMGSAWHPMYQEVVDYVRLLIPFGSAVRAAFTNVTWHGAVFLRDTVRDDAANIERLTHETSHLRLNLVMTRTRLHEHSMAERVPSPFRAGPRPITGLYHGAFVVTRAATALDAVARATGDERYARRVPILLTQVSLAAQTLRREVRLTSEGDDLLGAIEARLETLTAVHGRAASTEPRVYEEY
jgi:HEXXH motif-containing protein